MRRCWRNSPSKSQRGMGRFLTRRRNAFGTFPVPVLRLPCLLTLFVNRCLAHIINLATQAVISTYSKSKHYDPADPEADLTGPRMEHGRDEVGLVRAICVKVCSFPGVSSSARLDLVCCRRVHQQSANSYLSIFKNAKGSKPHISSCSTCPFVGHQRMS
jgi:hypothetical protein